MRLKLIIGLLIIGSSAFGQSMSVNWLKQSTFTAAGTNTYTVTATGVTQYVAGLELKIAFTNANTGASTLNVNALGARTLQKNGAALASGDIAAGGTYRITFDGTNFQVLGIGGGGGGGGASWLLASGGTLTGNNTITMGANTLTFTGNRVSFTPNATTAGLNIGVVSADPSSLVNGDIWQESTNGRIGVRVSGISNYLLSTVGADAISNRIPFYASGVQARVSTTANFTYNGTTLLVGGTTPTASTTLDVRGTGTDNTTSAARFANSANIQLMRLFNGGSLLLGGTTLTNDNTIFDIQSTTQGFAFPRMTTTQRNAITSPYSGLQIHSTTSNRPNWHNGTAWQEAASRSDLNGWLTGTFTDNIRIKGNNATTTFELYGADIDSGDAGGMFLDTATASFGWVDFSTGFSSLIQIQPTEMLVNDEVNSRGLVYALDYGTAGKSFGARWIPDWGNVLGAKTFTGRQTFATGNNGSLVVGTHTADDSSPVNGLIMYNTTSNTFRFRQNGAWVGLGGGGGGGVTDGDKGDITVTGSGATWTIDPQSVTYSKIQNVSPGRILGNSDVSATSIEQIAIGSGLSLSAGTISAIPYYAPTSLVVHSSNADYTAVANSVLHLPDGILTAARTLTIPTGANGDVIEIYCNEDTHAWNLAGATVYLADRTTVVTQLLFNVPTLMQRINGLWIIKN